MPGNTAALPNRLREGVAEFKFRAHDLLPNIVRELKQWSEIRWLVCWTAATTSRTQGGLTMHVSEVAEGDDAYAGVTHIATLDAAGEAVIHVVALKTLLQKARGPGLSCDVTPLSFRASLQAWPFFAVAADM
ncbi:hypothetical protein [Georgenia sp. SUBG003]|uniref:hypothetical protein n=1 Tax=Georgenia sp. SUBG003 TaxID=1497974 RepID=UPI003AB8DA23